MALLFYLMSALQLAKVSPECCTKANIQMQKMGAEAFVSAELLPASDLERYPCKGFTLSERA
jgi:hypothetical protein